MQKLLTEAGASLAGIPWNVYPRPQMVRKDWLCLNGMWDFEYGGTRTEKVIFAGDRGRVREQAVLHALGMLTVAAT